MVDIPPAASLRQIAKNTEHYFCVELPNGKRLFHNATKKSSGYQPRFPIHIARYVVIYCIVDLLEYHTPVRCAIITSGMSRILKGGFKEGLLTLF